MLLYMKFPLVIKRQLIPWMRGQFPGILLNFGVHIGDRKNLNWCTPFFAVSLWFRLQQFFTHVFRYIFVSVSTTMFIWMVFLPTYLTMFYSYHQSALLAFCLILNAFITMVCLFLPKLYAVYFVDENKLKFENSSGGGFAVSSTSGDSISSHMHGVPKPNQIVPIDWPYLFRICSPWIGW